MSQNNRKVGAISNISMKLLHVILMDSSFQLFHVFLQINSRDIKTPFSMLSFEP